MVSACMCYSIVFDLCIFSFFETENIYFLQRSVYDKETKMKLNRMLIKIGGGIYYARKKCDFSWSGDKKEMSIKLESTILHLWDVW